MEAVVQRCSCEHEFQDRRYGKERRVMNPRSAPKDKGGVQRLRCTVCGKEHIYVEKKR